MKLPLACFSTPVLALLAAAAGARRELAVPVTGEPHRPVHGAARRRADRRRRAPRRGGLEGRDPVASLLGPSTVNDNRDRDRGWTVENAIPWTGLAQLARPDGRSLPPREGDVWRMDFSRFNQYKEAPPSQDPGGWAWSPHGVWDYIPEVFP
jgi:hypothetical protein